MVVDDEPDTVDLVSLVLEGEGYEIMPAYTGREALDMLSDAKPDLILLDVKMPNMDGFEFLDQVKSSGFFSNIPVMMLSGVDSSPERVKCLKMGAMDFMIKPFNPEELLLKIEILLKCRTV